MARRPLVAVVGATATGKSEVAVAIAEVLGGEVVGADAYQLYRGLDIGTAKVDAATRARVPHHLIDLANAGDPWTLARYLEQAAAVLDDVWTRGKLPVLAGGSGQYVRALLEGWQPPRVPPNRALRSELEALAESEGSTAVYDRLAALDPAGAAEVDAQNVRRVMRTLEVVMTLGRPLAAGRMRAPIDADVLMLGLQLEREELYRRLDQRTDAMFRAGLVDEVRGLRHAGLGNTSPVRGGVGYKEVSLYLDGEIDLDEAVRRHKNANHRLVRRQNAWFRPGDPRIRWLDAGPDAPQRAVEAVRDWLAAKSEASVS